MQKKQRTKKVVNRKITPDFTGDYFRDVTVETIEALRSGSIKSIEANAIAKQVQYTIQRAKMQLEIMKFTGSKDKKAANALL